MIKILSNDQIKEADRQTIENESIESVDLMERAAKGCVEWLVARYPSSRPFVVLAGVGNNGGDALVIARRLLEVGYTVRTFVVRYSEHFSEDLQINLDRMKQLGNEVNYILEEAHFPDISSDTIIVDGIFGSGLNRKVEGLAALCIDQINASIAEVISIDIPSGMYPDKHTPDGSHVIEASFTLSFQVPKLGFFFRENQGYVGTWQIVRIGLDAAYMARATSPYYFVDVISEFASVFERDPYDHKGMFGHGLLIAGSVGMIGAAILASRAALRGGIGRLTVHVPSVGYPMMQTAVPEAMCSADVFDDYIGELPDLNGYSAIGCGPGIGLNKKTKRAIRNLVHQTKVPLVLDADALNILSESKDLLKELPPKSILTPHIGEFERLFGSSKNSFERMALLREMAIKYKIIIVLKGAHTAIASPSGEVFINATGNPGMATAGSGDVLTGIMTAFVSQVRDPLIAAICAVYVHGLAGDEAVKLRGHQALIASDIIDACGKAMLESFSS